MSDETLEPRGGEYTSEPQRVVDDTGLRKKYVDDDTDTTTTQQGADIRRRLGEVMGDEKWKKIQERYGDSESTISVSLPEEPHIAWGPDNIDEIDGELSPSLIIKPLEGGEPPSDVSRIVPPGVELTEVTMAQRPGETTQVMLPDEPSEVKGRWTITRRPRGLFGLNTVTHEVKGAVTGDPNALRVLNFAIIAESHLPGWSVSEKYRTAERSYSAFEACVELCERDGITPPRKIESMLETHFGQWSGEDVMKAEQVRNEIARGPLVTLETVFMETKKHYERKTNKKYDWKDHKDIMIEQLLKMGADLPKNKQGEIDYERVDRYAQQSSLNKLTLEELGQFYDNYFSALQNLEPELNINTVPIVAKSASKKDFLDSRKRAAYTAVGDYYGAHWRLFCKLVMEEGDRAKKNSESFTTSLQTEIDPNISDDELLKELERSVKETMEVGAEFVSLARTAEGRIELAPIQVPFVAEIADGKGNVEPDTISNIRAQLKIDGQVVDDEIKNPNVIINLINEEDMDKSIIETMNSPRSREIKSEMMVNEESPMSVYAVKRRGHEGKMYLEIIWANRHVLTDGVQQAEGVYDIAKRLMDREVVIGAPKTFTDEQEKILASGNREDRLEMLLSLIPDPEEFECNEGGVNENNTVTFAFDATVMFEARKMMQETEVWDPNNKKVNYKDYGPGIMSSLWLSGVEARVAHELGISKNALVSTLAASENLLRQLEHAMVGDANQDLLSPSKEVHSIGFPANPEHWVKVDENGRKRLHPQLARAVHTFEKTRKGDAEPGFLAMKQVEDVQKVRQLGWWLTARTATGSAKLGLDSFSREVGANMLSATNPTPLYVDKEGNRRGVPKGDPAKVENAQDVAMTLSEIQFEKQRDENGNIIYHENVFDKDGKPVPKERIIVVANVKGGLRAAEFAREFVKKMDEINYGEDISREDLGAVEYYRNMRNAA